MVENYGNDHGAGFYSEDENIKKHRCDPKYNRIHTGMTLAVTVLGTFTAVLDHDSCDLGRKVNNKKVVAAIWDCGIAAMLLVATTRELAVIRSRWNLTSLLAAAAVVIMKCVGLHYLIKHDDYKSVTRRHQWLVWGKAWFGGWLSIFAAILGTFTTVLDHLSNEKHKMVDDKKYVVAIWDTGIAALLLLATLRE